MIDAVVVGSGPNGLAAAVTLARAGLSVEVIEAEETIGGGARTLPSTTHEGIEHDVCSAVQPMALASPFFREFDLVARGVGMVAPDLAYAQPFDDGPAALAYRSLEKTADGLGEDGPAWHDLFGALVRHADTFVQLALGDRTQLARTLARADGIPAAVHAGLRVLETATPAWNARFETERSRALITGVASHSISPLPGFTAAGTSLLLATLAHHVGWPIPTGGSQSIINAMVDDLERHGGRVVTGRRIRSAADLPAARVVLADLPPGAALSIWRERLPSRVRRGLARFRHGHAAAKVDFVLRGPVPWRDERVGAAATVHVAGTRADMVTAESKVQRGRLPERPVVLFSDAAVADPGRERDGLRPGWAYAHVPAGCPVDPVSLVTAQIERFAPGFRDVVASATGTPASRMHEHNANLVGGDIAGGATGMLGFLLRPRPAIDPYELSPDGIYLCSASAPPGPGVHGMPGWIAARRALRDQFGLPAPSLAP
ncbi:phytoene dehydrogenase [Pseudoclavibacter endophyticus]|uniref:NAD(P)/FAD-dependent oxidoreductase n=1 Tax=Pseudoclavibacter endophyticus TaxID=1778590 RepID=A0A6H9WQ84_9MICO|nr:NAD(P)/FAD-dependent oxidoreductase [Pseudoclavibacter endophyticus]KAB1648955.1 NAD(P)/FAD-dependent oxidoreductase [Pseudoclavibacter endophyticus]GGA66774.1 phytoene dehydrogenase [Pseudoclavibacter endophyticus]